MNNATARFASEGTDYLSIIKSFFIKNGSKSAKLNNGLGPIIVKILGLEFRHYWHSGLRAEYKTALGRVRYLTIDNNDGDSISVGTYLDGDDGDTSRDVIDSSELVEALKEDIAALNAQTAASARVIAKRPALTFGDVTVPIQAVKGDKWYGDWKFTHNGQFKLEVYGFKSTVKHAYLKARKAGTVKRVGVSLKGRISINNLQQKLDEAIAANKLVLVAPESAKTSGTVKIGDDVVNVSVTSMKLFERHIGNLQKLYGVKKRAK